MASPFRKKLRNWIMLGILGIGLIAIVITGFGTDGMGGLGGVGGQSAQTVATVGGEKLTDAEMSRRVDVAFREFSQQQPTLQRAQFVDSYFNQMMEAILDSKATAIFARRMGFVVPPSMIDRIIVEAGAFRNVAGQFDNAAFQQYLQQQNISERQLREDLEIAQLLRMVVEPVAGGARVANAVATEYTNLQLETRVGQLGGVPTALLAQSLQPSDQEVAAFYQQNQRLFQLPERRVVRFALIGREQLGDAVRATDQEIAAYYQQNQGRYGPGETRNLQLFTTQDEAAARRLAEQVRGGMPFVQAAQAAGFTAEDVNLPNLTREQLAGRTSAELANSAFGAQQGALLGPLRTQLGFQVVRVDAIARTSGRPLEAVRGEIVAAVEQRKLSEQINARIEAIEELLRDGSSLDEVARAQGLTLETSPAMTATGAAPNFQFPEQLAPLLRSAFEYGPDDDPVVEIVQPDQQAALLQVAQIVPPAAPPLAQIRDQVRQRLIQQTALQRAKAIADGIVNRINGGMASPQAYAQAGMRLPTPREETHRRFEVSRPGQRVSPPITLLFSIPQGRARTLPAPDGGGWIIVHHVRRTPGNAAADPLGAEILRAMQTELLQNAGRELQDQFARAIRSTVEVTRDEAQIEALRQRLRTGQ
jgi:peptidyl-prolyl cis-trans isomerase D